MSEATITPNTEDLQAKVQALEEEVEALEEQRRDALEQIRRAERRHAVLEGRRKELAPQAFRGDAGAQLELEGLEDEQEELGRSSSVAKAAEPGLGRMLEEAKERLKAARQDVHRARAQVVHDELKDVEARRDALAEELKGALAEHSRIYSNYMEAVRLYSQDAANNLATYRPDMHGRWLRKAFSKWM